MCVYILLQVARANFNEDPYVRDFGVSIETKMVNVSGRILPPPLLQYGGKVSSLLCTYISRAHLSGVPGEMVSPTHFLQTLMSPTPLLDLNTRVLT